MDKFKSLIFIGVSAAKEKGLLFFLRRVLDYSINIFRWQYYRVFEPIKEFEIGGKKYHYFFHIYNITWKNSRAVEIPYAKKYIHEYGNKEVLEVGNVLSWYIPGISHDIVDKYEISDGIINEDIINYSPDKKFDLVISISTLEHVGWDECPKDAQKVIRALTHLQTLLKDEGKIVLTVPIGYHQLLDSYIESKKIKFEEKYFLIKGKGVAEWSVISLEDSFNKIKNGQSKWNDLVFLGVLNKKSYIA